MAALGLKYLDTNAVVVYENPIANVTFSPQELSSELRELTPVGLLSLIHYRLGLEIIFEPLRLLVRDKSGKPPGEQPIGRFVEELHRVVRKGDTLKDFGVNFEMVFPVPGGQNAGVYVIETLFRDHLKGNAAGLNNVSVTLKGQANGQLYSISIEPRWQRPDTKECFVRANVTGKSLVESGISAKAVDEAIQSGAQQISKSLNTIFGQ